MFASATWGQVVDAPTPELAGVPAETPDETQPAVVPVSIDVLDYLETVPIAQARRDIRRAARSEASDAVRVKALGMLASRDPSAATGRICGRALRTDPEAKVRRAAAKCLGRLPQRFMGTEQVSLIGALEDENIDVVNMAGWALARTDGVTALPRIRELTSHPDPRVAQLFTTYATRLDQQEQSRAQRLERVEKRRLRARERRRASLDDGFEVALGASWLALYGGLSGYLHGAMVPLGHLNASDFSVLGALSGGITGFALGGTFGLSQKLSFNQAHAIVQIGSLATIAGYSTGWLSETGPARGLNAVSYGLMGSLLGNGLALSLVHFVRPSAGSLAFGVVSGGGIGFTTAILASGYGFSAADSMWAGLWSGSLTGLVATVVASPFDWATLPLFSAAAFGCVGALLGAMGTPTFGVEQAWAIAGGAGVGAAAGAVLGFTVPAEADPFYGNIRVQAPAVSWLPAAKNGTSPQPLVSVAGSFSL